MTTARKANPVRARLLGLAATLGITLFLAGVPSVLIVIGALPSSSTWDRTREVLASPDDGTLAIGAAVVVAWIAWALMTTCLTVEVIARLRGVQVPRLPGLAAPQLAAGRLVTVAALLFTTVPSTAPVQAHVAATLVTDSPPVPGALRPTSVSAPRAPAAAPSDVAVDARDRPSPPATRPHTVRRGESLWSIARDQLGDGRRFVELVELNSEVLGGRPDFIPPGLVLLVPDETRRGEGTDTHVVEPGETLSEIALEELDDATRYPEIYQASRSTLQPDGQRLRDPDLILPGWELTIPDDSDAPPPRPPRAGTADPPVRATAPADPPVRATAPADPPAPPAESQPPYPAPGVEDSAQPEIPASTPEATDLEMPSWLLLGLTGAGTMLAGALLLVLRAHRRTHLRHRRPGQLIAPVPPEFKPVEKTARVIGADSAAYLEQLDLLLRELGYAVALAGGPRPQVMTVQLTDKNVTLHLAQDADLPAPWSGDERTWTTALDAAAGTGAGEIPPYPLLVTIGRDDRGSIWLADLERLKVVEVTGDPDAAAALGRFVAAELAMNPWSGLVTVDLLDVGSELAGLGALWFDHHAADDTSFLNRLAKELGATYAAEDDDPELLHALVTTATHAQSGPVRRVLDLVTSHPGRTGAAVVTVGRTAGPNSVEFEVTPAGRLHVPALGLDLVPVGLSEQEATVCTALVDLTRDAHEVAPVPVDNDATDGWQALADAAGALRVDLTTPRPQGPAGQSSLLPHAAEEYESAAATTTEDIETLAPLISDEVRSRVEESDPDLDADLAAWFDPDSPLPKLTLLGPVNARAHGNPRAVTNRKPHCVELLAYLALNPHGVTSHRLADSFDLTVNRVRTDVGNVRSWLGVDPRTGLQHVPPAKETRAYAATGEPAYQVDGLLVDLDLFRRLRARGQARGADGIADLETALRLVSGQPFTLPRDKGWSWLLDDPHRLYDSVEAAIVDVAHIVTTRALAEGDLTSARFAAETASRAVPFDEIARLDLIAVTDAEGHHELAERMRREDVYNRSDDERAPIDLPDRTARIADRSSPKDPTA